MTTKAVIVTGAAGGIGMATVRLLLNDGLTVYAGGIDDWELAQLSKLGKELNDRKLIPVLLDLRERAHMEAVLKRVEAEGNELYGLVLNGAACPSFIPFEHLDFALTRDVFETNVIGNLTFVQLAVNQLKKSRGRIVIVSSLFGKTGIALALSYACSKHATEAFGLMLRRDLKPFGIKVIITNPGVVKRTYMVAKQFHVCKDWLVELDGVTPESVSRYDFDMGGNTRLMQPKQVLDPKYRSQYKGCVKMFEATAPDDRAKAFISTPESCARTIRKALTVSNPKTRYIDGLDAKLFMFLTWLLPEKWMDAIANITATAD